MHAQRRPTNKRLTVGRDSDSNVQTARALATGMASVSRDQPLIVARDRPTLKRLKMPRARDQEMLSPWRWIGRHGNR